MLSHLKQLSLSGVPWEYQFYLNIWGIRVCFYQRTHSYNMSSFNLALQGFELSAFLFLKKLGPWRAALTYRGGTCRWLESKTLKHYHYFVWCLILPDFYSVYTMVSVSQVWDTHLHKSQGHMGSGAGLKVEASSEQPDRGIPFFSLAPGPTTPWGCKHIHSHESTLV